MLLQLDPPIPLTCPKGPALAHFLIDRGIELDLEWVCAIDATGECWTFKNPQIRFQKNITQGRTKISEFAADAYRYVCAPVQENWRRACDVLPILKDYPILLCFLGDKKFEFWEKEKIWCNKQNVRTDLIWTSLKIEDTGYSP
jgi:hypothetical protein